MRFLIGVLLAAVLVIASPAGAAGPLTCDDLKDIPSLYTICKADEEGDAQALCYRDWKPITQADERDDAPGVFTAVATCRSGGNATGGGFNIGDAREMLASQPHISAGRVIGWECTVAGRNRKNPQCFVVCCR
ncbi:MAG: hypothetical protein RIC16_05035 [Rhodospirillales bacterium]